MLAIRNKTACTSSESTFLRIGNWPRYCQAANSQKFLRAEIFLAQKFSGWEGRRTAGGGAPAAAAAAAKIEKRVGWRWLEKSPKKNPNVEEYSSTPLATANLIFRSFLTIFAAAAAAAGATPLPPPKPLPPRPPPWRRRPQKLKI